jgi:hypothetical protein
MKTIAPILVLLLASCNPPAPDLSPITKEIASLKAGLEELKKVQQPTFDTQQAQEDLAKEIRRLRDRMAQPPLPAAPAAGAALPVPAPQAGFLQGGVGGTQAGLNDLYWVLTKLTVDKEERLVLAMYQGNHRGIKLAGVRMLNADLQLVEYNGDKPTVKQVVEELKRVK